MKTLKLLSMLVFAVCLIASVSAVAVYGDWEDSSQNAVISYGESISFNGDFISISPPMIINIILYDSESNVVESFENNANIDDNSYFPSYAINSNVYSESGDYELVLTASDSEGFLDSHTLYLTVEELPDTTAPVITLLGDAEVNIPVGEPYTDAGATALDDVDGDITDQIVIGGDTVDVNTVGTYIITYNVQDSSGHSADEVTRTVNVVEDGNDTTAPVITVIVPTEAVYSIAEMTFVISTDEQATAEYSLDGASSIAMTETSTNVFESEILSLSKGEHTVVFTATDAAGNSATKTSTFSIDLSNKPPVISVITPEEDKEYDESKLTFKVEVDEVAKVVFFLDNGEQITMDYKGTADGILTFEYEIELSDGNHEVIFYATDAARNTASITIEFLVDTSKDTDEDDKTYTNYYQSDYEEQLYLNQFKKPKIIYIEEDKQPEYKMTWWEKFIEWLKRIFGFS